MNVVYRFHYSCFAKGVRLISRVVLVAIVLTPFVFSSVALARSLEEDVRVYIDVFNGDPKLHSAHADTFSYMGLSDIRLFDVIEKRLLADYQAARDDRAERNRVARYIRALGFSGQPKYVTTIQQFVGEPGYERFAAAALHDLPLYQKWNPIISNRATFDPKYSDDANRVMNMLRVNDLQLNGLGAKRVYFATQEDAVVELLAKQLRANYMMSTTAESRESLAWMVKALGYTKKEKYRPLIEEVAAGAADKRVRDHALKSLVYFKKA